MEKRRVSLEVFEEAGVEETRRGRHLEPGLELPRERRVCQRAP